MFHLQVAGTTKFQKVYRSTDHAKPGVFQTTYYTTKTKRLNPGSVRSPNKPVAMWRWEAIGATHLPCIDDNKCPHKVSDHTAWLQLCKSQTVVPQ